VNYYYPVSLLVFWIFINNGEATGSKLLDVDVDELVDDDSKWPLTLLSILFAAEGIDQILESNISSPLDTSKTVIFYILIYYLNIITFIIFN